MDEFWNRVEKTDACWFWRGRLNKDGYGQLYFKGRTHVAHRVALVLIGIDIPTGLEVDHTCNVRNCVNPNHLEPVTRLENRRRRAQRQTHCKNGHEFTVENTLYHTKSHARVCRTCSNALRNAWAREHRKSRSQRGD